MTPVTIIMYHYVRDFSATKYPGIKGLDVKNFEAQLAYLYKNYNIISVEMLIDCIDNKTNLPKKAALLTFDDGYIDHFQYVLPLLSHYKIKGAFYPPARPILEKKVLDVNKIHFILASVQNKEMLMKELLLQLDKYRDEYDLTENDVYLDRYFHENRFDTKEVIFLKRMLQLGLPEELRKIIANELFQKYVEKNEEDFSNELYMNTNMLKTLSSEGMHIGSHGYGHYWLGSLTKQKQEIEINQSMDFLREIGADMNNWTICYPYGNSNADTIEILKSRGCKLGFTSAVNIAHATTMNRFELPRLDTNDLPRQKDAEPNSWYQLA